MRQFLIRFGTFLLLPLYFVILFTIFNPSAGFYMGSELRRLGSIKHNWVKLDDFSSVMARSVVAAEDANFCDHQGFDMKAIMDTIKNGSNRGASTITQQTAKNVYLWHGRNYVRKGLEAGFTVLIELFWTKKRIIEVYLNVAEFDTGVFGIQAAAQHHYGIDAVQLNRVQAGRLAVVLPDPKGRSAVKPSAKLRKRAASVIAGADMIRRDGRSSCFEG